MADDPAAEMTPYPKYGHANPKHGHGPGYEPVGAGVNLGAADGVPTAHYPPGNYRYDDSVFDRA